MNKLDNIFVKDFISTKRKIPTTISKTQTVQEAASIFKNEGIDEIVVLDEKNHVVGMLTQRQVFHSLMTRDFNNLVSEVMDRTFPILLYSDSLTKAIDYFEKGTNAIPILKEDQSFLNTLKIEDIRNILQKELDLLRIDFDHFPLNLLDSSGLLKILKGVSDDPYIRICITDERGILRFFNRAYEELTGINREEAVGKHVTEIFPESRLPYVLETGKPEVRYYRSSFEDRYIVSRRIPLKEGKKIIGALSLTLFRDISEMEDLLHRFNLLKNKMEYYKKELESIRFSKYRIENIIGQSPQILHMKDLIYKYALGDSTILIMGESGTGKELVAHAIHQVSKRKHHPLIVVNCASIPRDLLESELFGYEPGSFTGASQKGKLGKFELAHKGTIFLDEVGDMPQDIQAKLLRVLQEKEIERIGGRKPIPVDFRLIAATNKNLDSLVKEGKFRDDLYYRLKVLTLGVPSLRERKEDISLLTQYILDRLNSKLGKQIKRIDDDIAMILAEYNWPGNVRELENILEYAVNNANSDTITKDCLPSPLKQSSHRPTLMSLEVGKPSLQEAMDEFEKSLLLEALEKTKGSRIEAAKMLGTSRSGLYKLLKKFKID